MKKKEPKRDLKDEKRKINKKREGKNAMGEKREGLQQEERTEKREKLGRMKKTRRK